MAGKKKTAKKGSSKNGLKDEALAPEEKKTYFKDECNRVNDFIPTGCTLLDCVLGGGYAVGKIINIVGDTATSKSASVIEASATFTDKFPDGHVVYAESEAAFDKAYAESLGMPVDKIEFREEDSENEVLTVEDFYNDLVAVCERSADDNVPTLYILDSLDALSDDAEMNRGISEGTYGASKAKMLSQIFRRITKQMNKSNVTLIVVSQIRDNIDALAFGKKYSRSGGKALDFYASQIIYLAKTGSIYKTIKGVKKTIGIKVKAKCTKNKVGVPHRECDYPYRFNYGIDDVQANINWLESNGFLKKVTDKKKKQYDNEVEAMSDEDYWQEAEKLANKVTDIWWEVESEFQPKRKKY